MLSNDLDRFRNRRHLTRDDFVIGVALEDAATGYAYRLASRERIINDTIGAHPVVVIVDPETRDVRVYLRRAAAQGSDSPLLLTFNRDSQGRVVDVETGTVWGAQQGVATAGALAGAQIQQVPWVSSYDWAWQDFFPHTLFYQGE